MLLVSIHAEIHNQSGGTQCYIAETHAPPCAPLLIAQSHRIDGAASHHDAARVAVRRLVKRYTSNRGAVHDQRVENT
jgi:hypothetical protein